jgi:deoxyribonuclease-1
MTLFKLIKSVIFLVLIFIQSAVFASSSESISRIISYYPDEFYQELNVGSSSQSLVLSLKNILKNYHVLQLGKNDLVVSACSAQEKCYSHKALSYGAARTLLMGKLHLVRESSGEFAIHDVYCNKNRLQKEFRKSPPGPSQIPDVRVINVEHTWPQSRFTGRYPRDTQKSDLHHLFPTDTKINAIRGNSNFGEVSRDLIELSCPEARFGLGTSGSDEVFEPPREHRGNIARALFYFSIRYDLSIDENEEVILRKWNKEDPIDEAELWRNEEVFKVQGNRNPFIDFKELADRVADF